MVVVLGLSVVVVLGLYVVVVLGLSVVVVLGLYGIKIRVAHFFGVLCSPIMCLYVLGSVL